MTPTERAQMHDYAARARFSRYPMPAPHYTANTADRADLLCVVAAAELAARPEWLTYAREAAARYDASRDYYPRPLDLEALTAALDAGDLAAARRVICASTYGATVCNE